MAIVWGRGELAQSSWPAVGALMLAMVSFILGASLGKQLFPVVGAEGVTALRLALGALILAGMLRPWRVRLGASTWRPVLVYGVCMAVMNLLYYMALRTLTFGVALALEFTGPLAVALLSSRRRVDFLWIAFAVAGLILFAPRSAAAHIDPTGAALALGAGVCWGIYIIAGKRAGQHFGAATPALGATVGAIVVLPIGLVHAGAALFQPQVLIVALMVALLSTVLPYTLEMFALRRLAPQTYGTLTSAEPAVGAAIGWLVLGETLPLVQVCAMGLIIVASIGTALTAARARPSAVPDLAPG
jgi:inner membrane transporter RhtA